MPVPQTAVRQRARPQALGVVHRGVGAIEQVVGGLVRARGRDADAGLIAPPSAQGSLQRAQNPVGDGHELLLGEGREHDEELVAAEPADGPGAAEARGDPVRGLDSTASPRSWPSRSLTSLNPSRSTNITAVVSSSSDFDSVAVMDIRLARPVSASVVA